MVLTDANVKPPTRTVPLCANLTAAIVLGTMRHEVGTVKMSTSVKVAVHLSQRAPLLIATLATRVTVYVQMATARAMQVSSDKTLVPTTLAILETLVTAVVLILANVASDPATTSLSVW